MLRRLINRIMPWRPRRVTFWHYLRRRWNCLRGWHNGHDEPYGFFCLWCRRWFDNS